MDRFSTSFSSKFTYFSSLWPRHGAIRAAFGTIQAVTSCGPLRTVEQSPRKRESGSFHENRPLLLAIRELPPPDRCARLAPMSPTPVCGRLRCSLKELWIEDQLEFMRLRCVSIRVRCVGWRPGRGQRSQRALPQTTRFGRCRPIGSLPSVVSLPAKRKSRHHGSLGGYVIYSNPWKIK